MIGLDLRFPMIRWCSFHQRSSRYALERFGECRVESEDSLPSAVETLLSSVANRRTKIAIALPESQVFMKSVEVPHGMSRIEQLDEVKRLARPYLPYDPELMTFDVITEGEGLQNADRIRILWVATATEWVEERLGLLSSWARQVCVVDVESLALQRAAAVEAPFPPGEATEWALSVGLALRLWA